MEDAWSNASAFLSGGEQAAGRKNGKPARCARRSGTGDPAWHGECMHGSVELPAIRSDSRSFTQASQKALMEATPPTPVPDMVDADRLRHFVANISDYAIYTLTPEGYINSWNNGAQRFKGYTPEEIIGQHFSLFYTDEDRANGKPARNLRTALEQGKFEDEGWRVRKDGTRFWANVVVDPIRDDDGKLIGFAKITRDITERKQAQEALLASEERFRLLVQSVTDYAIFMLSPEGVVINWNAGAERIKGYTHDEIVGSHFSRFYTDEDRAAGIPARGLAAATREGRFEIEGWRVRKDGTRFWAHVVIDAIRNDMGDLVGFAKITRDVTERRQAAEALERTREALFQSQKLEALGKLTGGVAHDFNNLLGVIVTGLEILVRQAHDPSIAKVVDSMQRAASSGAKLTQQLLSFARQQPLRQDRYNLARLIGGFEAVLRRACDETIAFQLTFAPELKPVLIDATQFETALLNLVSNARDAMPGGGTLTISAENVRLAQNQIANLAAGEYVKVSVRDTGSGMPSDVMARAIEPFFTTKEIGKGTGMGLSQVYGLVQQSGGELTLESEIGKGTDVSMYLPVNQGVPAGETASTEDAAGSEKALVVDDQPDVLAMALKLFQTLGYEVLSANNGRDAVEILKRTPDIDVLFTDVLMPGMDGVSLAREADSLIPGIKIILASGFPAPALGKEEDGDPHYAFVNKPYRLAEIAKILRKA